ncbi:YraN family protein [Patescibacteria group bacterium]|nr:YraN family protein [Patescibacteria group bacterium]
MDGENKRIGQLGEEIASNYLLKKGYQIIERNFRAKQYGEVDILAQHRDTLVFVEVKTRIGDEFGRPGEAITPGKLHELKKMVDFYYNQYPNTSLSPQIDVIAITLKSDEAIDSLEHFENITL